MSLYEREHTDGPPALHLRKPPRAAVPTLRNSFLVGLSIPVQLTFIPVLTWFAVFVNIRGFVSQQICLFCVSHK